MKSTGKQYVCVVDMMRDIDPEFADDLAKHIKKPSVRFRKWRDVKWLLFKIWLQDRLGRS